MKKYELKVKELKTKFETITVTSSKDAADYIRKFYSSDINIYESCFILLLNQANQTIGYAKISQGGVAGTVVDIKIIAKYCVDTLASNCIFAHNHPSGKLEFSHADLHISRKTKDALALLDVKLLDSLVITENGYKSMMDDDLF